MSLFLSIPLSSNASSAFLNKLINACWTSFGKSSNGGSSPNSLTSSMSCFCRDKPIISMVRCTNSLSCTNARWRSGRKKSRKSLIVRERKEVVSWIFFNFSSVPSVVALPSCCSNLMEDAIMLIVASGWRHWWAIIANISPIEAILVDWTSCCCICCSSSYACFNSSWLVCKSIADSWISWICNNSWFCRCWKALPSWFDSQVFAGMSANSRSWSWDSNCCRESLFLKESVFSNARRVVNCWIGVATRRATTTEIISPNRIRSASIIRSDRWFSATALSSGCWDKPMCIIPTGSPQKTNWRRASKTTSPAFPRTSLSIRASVNRICSLSW